MKVALNYPERSFATDTKERMPNVSVVYDFGERDTPFAPEIRERLKTLLLGQTVPAAVCFIDPETGRREYVIGRHFGKGRVIKEQDLQSVGAWVLELDWSQTPWNEEIKQLLAANKQIDLRERVERGEMVVSVRAGWSCSDRAYSAIMTLTPKEAKRLGEALIEAATLQMPLEGRELPP